MFGKRFLLWLVITVATWVIVFIIVGYGCGGKSIEPPKAKAAEAPSPCDVDFAHFDRTQCVRFIEYRILQDMGKTSVTGLTWDTELRILEELQRDCIREPLTPEKQ